MTEGDKLIKLGKRIRTIRARKNIPQFELAMKCNFGKASMSRIESGQANPTICTLYKICKVLEVDIVELFRN